MGAPPGREPHQRLSSSSLLAGLPKAVPISHGKIWAMSLCVSFIGLTSKDVVYASLPLYHSAGFMGCTSAIENGRFVLDHTSVRRLFRDPLRSKGHSCVVRRDDDRVAE